MPILDRWGNPLVREETTQDIGWAQDAWANGQTGIGVVGLDKTKASTYLPVWRVLDPELTSLMNGSHLARKIVFKRSDEMFRRGFGLEADNVKSSEVDDVRDYATDVLQLETNLRNAKRWGRGYGGCLLLMGIDDGRYPWEPLDEDNIRDFYSLSLVDRRYSYVQSQYSQMGASSQYGQARVYLVSNAVAGYGWEDQGALQIRPKTGKDLLAQGAQVALVHESRVLRFDGNEPDVTTRQSLAGWSWSVLQVVYDEMRRFEGSFDSTSYLLSDASQGVFKLQGLMKAITSGQRAAFTQRLMMIEQSRSVMRAVALDAGTKDGLPTEDFKREQTPLGGIAEILDKLMLIMAAAADMPATELFGRAPAGLNATGESDTRKWYDTIETEQKNDLGPQIKRIFKLIAKAKRGPLGRRDVKWKLKFHPLWSPTDSELATTRLANAQRDDIYLTQGVVKPEEVAVDLDEIYPNLDVEAREKVLSAGVMFDPYENQPAPETSSVIAGQTAGEPLSPPAPLPLIGKDTPVPQDKRPMVQVPAKLAGKSPPPKPPVSKGAAAPAVAKGAKVERGAKTVSGEEPGDAADARSDAATAGGLPDAAIVILWDAAGRIATVSRPEPPHEMSLPGGLVDPGETPEQAAARELGEELGLEVDRGALEPAGKLSSPTDGRTVWVFSTSARRARGTLTAAEPGTRAAWMTPADLLTHAQLYRSSVAELMNRGLLSTRSTDRADAAALDALDALVGWRQDAKEARAVFQHLLEDYPAASCGWVLGMHWHKAEEIPLDQIDDSNRDSWSASQDGTVASYAERIEGGTRKPAVLVKAPDGRFKIVDGHHRYLASEQLGIPLLAYWAEVHVARGPWDELHAAQKKGTSGARSGSMPQHWATANAPRSDFDDAEPRDETGKWTAGGGGGSSKAAAGGRTRSMMGGTVVRAEVPHEPHVAPRSMMGGEVLRGAAPSVAAPAPKLSFAERLKAGLSSAKGALSEKAQGLLASASSHVRGFFTDPQARKEALKAAASGLRNAPKNIALHVVHEIKETLHDGKTALQGIGVVLKGGRMTPEQKTALKRTALKVAVAVASRAVAGVLPVEFIHAEIGRKVLEKIGHHIAEKAFNKVASGLTGVELDGLYAFDANDDPEEWLATRMAAAVADELEGLSDDDLAAVLEELAGEDGGEGGDSGGGGGGGDEDGRGDAHDPKRARGPRGTWDEEGATLASRVARDRSEAARASASGDQSAHLDAAKAHGLAARARRAMASRHAELGNTQAAARHAAAAEGHERAASDHVIFATTPMRGDGEWNEVEHPREPDGKFGSGGGTGSTSGARSAGPRPSFAQHPAGHIEGARVWTDKLPAGLTHDETWKAHYDKHPDQGGKPSAERYREVHEPIIRAALDVAPPAAGEQKLAIMTMGAPASGKSSALRGVDTSRFVKIDADAVKEQLPEYKAAIADHSNTYRFAAPMAHEESSAVSKEIFRRAVAEGKHVIVDSTGAKAESFEQKMAALRAAGYKVQVVMPHLGEEEGIRRLKDRAQKTGRLVPEDFARKAYHDIPRNFERLARGADDFKLVDNSSREPRIVWEGGRGREDTIHDRAFVDKFRAEHKADAADPPTRRRASRPKADRPGGAGQSSRSDAPRMLSERLALERALDKIHEPVVNWIHRPSEGKEGIRRAYASLEPKERALLDEHTRDVFRREHGGPEAVMYRYKDDGRRGLMSVSPVAPTYLPRDQYTAFKVRDEDVLAHYGQDDSPLATRSFGHEKEVILKPDAKPDQLPADWKEKDHPRDENGRFSSDGDWNEGDHPRGPDGKFGGGAAGPKPPADATALQVRAATPAEFRAAFAKAFEGSPFAEHVTHYSEEQLAGMKLFTTEDGKAGVAVHDHGDGRIEATALFNAGGAKGAGLGMLRHAIDQAGANYVECYGPRLNRMYATLGFKETGRSRFNREYASPKWSFQRFDSPNYYTMSLTGAGARGDSGDFDDDKHPRGPDGKFSSGGGGESGASPGSKGPHERVWDLPDAGPAPDEDPVFNGSKDEAGFGATIDSRTRAALDHAEAVRDFTSGSGMWYDIRGFEKDPEGWTAAHPRQVEAFSKMREFERPEHQGSRTGAEADAHEIGKFFEKSTPSPGIVYRGLAADTAQLERLLDPKHETITMAATSSSSRHAEVGMNFAQQSQRQRSQTQTTPVVLRLREKSGVAVEHLSHQTQEREILLPKGAQFRITGRTQSGGFLIVDGVEI